MYADISMRIADGGYLEVISLLRAAPLPLLSVIVGATVILDLRVVGSSPHFTVVRHRHDPRGCGRADDVLYHPANPGTDSRPIIRK